MPRIDDYKNARKLAIEKLAADSFDTILQRTGLEAVGADQFRVPFLNRAYRIGLPELKFKDETDSKWYSLKISRKFCRRKISPGWQGCWCIGL
jgi:hypothetical protein